MHDQAITKRCGTCGEAKALEDFYRNRRAKDGRQGRCTSCQKADQASAKGRAQQAAYRASDRGRAINAAYRASGKGKAAQTAYERSDHGKAYRRAYRVSDRGREVNADADRRRREKYPGKEVARHAVNNAIRSGHLARASAQICVCGEPAAEYHHQDYSRPLDVVALCQACHRAIHQRPSHLHAGSGY